MIGFASLDSVVSKLTCPISSGLHPFYRYFLICVGGSIYMVPKDADTSSFYLHI